VNDDGAPRQSFSTLVAAYHANPTNRANSDPILVRCAVPANRHDAATKAVAVIRPSTKTLPTKLEDSHRIRGTPRTSIPQTTIDEMAAPSG
jgi:hypothetical protein